MDDDGRLLAVSVWHRQKSSSKVKVLGFALTFWPARFWPALTLSFKEWNAGSSSLQTFVIDPVDGRGICAEVKGWESPLHLGDGQTGKG